MNILVKWFQLILKSDMVIRNIILQFWNWIISNVFIRDKDISLSSPGKKYRGYFLLLTIPVDFTVHPLKPTVKNCKDSYKINTKKITEHLDFTILKYVILTPFESEQYLVNTHSPEMMSLKDRRGEASQLVLGHFSA